MSEARNLLRVYRLFRRWRSGVKEEGLAISTEPVERALTCLRAWHRMAGKGDPVRSEENNHAQAILSIPVSSSGS